MWAVVLCENIGNKKKMTRYGAGTGKRELEKKVREHVVCVEQIKGFSFYSHEK